MNETTMRPATSAVDGTTGFLDTIEKAWEGQDWAAVKEACTSRLDEDSTDLEALFAESVASYYLQDLAGAAEAAKQGFDLAPTNYEFADLLSIYFAMAGELNTCVYYAKVTTTQSRAPRLADARPKNFPKFATAYQKISERPLLQLGDYSRAQGKPMEAEKWYRQHLAFEPDNRDAHAGLAMSLLSLGEVRAAVDTLRAARHSLPHDARIADLLGNALFAVGSFAEGKACHRWACSEAPDNPTIHASALVDRLYDPDEVPAALAADFAAWGARFGVTDDDDEPPEYAAPVAKDRLVVGYIVGDIGARRSGVALAQILMHHDKERFETVGFGHGELSDGANIVFQKCMGRWHDISAVDPVTLRYIVAAEQVDVLIDVAGFTAPESLRALGARLAPCQAAWLESPLGTGLAGMDYRITDRILDPTDPGTAAPTERPVRLDLGSQMVTPLLYENEPLAPRRPETDEIVFAADAPLKDLNPQTVELWARILHAVPQSKIVLRDYEFSVQENLTQLIGLFGSFGLAHRADVVSESLSTSFFEMADVALMPVPFPKVHSAFDALWSGAPVVCLNGEGRHGRQAASFVAHLGLEDEMVAADAEAYVRLAADWANDVARRRGFRDGIRDRFANADSVNPAARARDLEALIERLWEETCNGAQ